MLNVVPESTSRSDCVAPAKGTEGEGTLWQIHDTALCSSTRASGIITPPPRSSVLSRSPSLSQEFLISEPTLENPGNDCLVFAGDSG